MTQTSIQPVWVFAALQIPNRKPGRQLRIRENGTVFTDERGSKLAMTAKTCRTFHIALHGNKEPVQRNAALSQSLNDESHHDLRTNDESNCPGRIKFDARNKNSHWSNGVLPSRRSGINCKPDVDTTLAPGCHFLRVKEDVGSAASNQQRNSSVAATV